MVSNSSSTSISGNDRVVGKIERKPRIEEKPASAHPNHSRGIRQPVGIRKLRALRTLLLASAEPTFEDGNCLDASNSKRQGQAHMWARTACIDIFVCERTCMHRYIRTHMHTCTNTHRERERESPTEAETQGKETTLLHCILRILVLQTGTQAAMYHAKPRTVSRSPACSLAQQPIGGSACFYAIHHPSIPSLRRSISPEPFYLVSRAF